MLADVILIPPRPPIKRIEKPLITLINSVASSQEQAAKTDMASMVRIQVLVLCTVEIVWLILAYD